MNRIKTNLERLKNNKEMGFMGHIIAGYPDYEYSKEAGLGIIAGGASFLEVQFPFSDPVADGPTIEGACYESINHGFKIEQGFQLCQELVIQSEAAIIIVTYANIVFRYGVDAFIKKAAEVGVSGVIIPDLPIENDEKIRHFCNVYGLCNILLAAPGGEPSRIKLIAEASEGFVYVVTRRGITGKKTEIDTGTKAWLKQVRENSSLPFAVGFGIRSSEQVSALKGLCDIVVVGSHFVQKITEAVQQKKSVKIVLKEETARLLGQV